MKKDLTNQVVGQWKILGFSHRKYKQGNVLIWRCQCSCGNVRWKTTGNLGDPQQQRCSSCASSDRNTKRTKYKKPFEALFRRLVLVARLRKLKCTLTYEDFFAFTGISTCVYCNAELRWNLSSQAMATNLDRKDNSLGYEQGNCVVCCATCNHIKSNRFTFEQMLEVGALIKKWRAINE